MPPGTGDTQLSMSQNIPIDGELLFIVTRINNLRNFLAAGSDWLKLSELII